MNNFMTTGRAPMRDMPGNGAITMTVPGGAIVSDRNKSETAPYHGVAIVWQLVSYRGTDGWIYEGYLMPYAETLPTNVFKISLATPSETDVPQNLIWDGRMMVNQCGELCVSYVFDITIAELLAKWQRVNSWFYQYTFGGYRDRGTDERALLDMIDVLDCGVRGERYADLLHDPVRNLTREYPHLVARLLGDYQIITSVTIDRLSGRLAPRGILHWVVLERVEVERDGGLVYLANPYHNRIERYAWGEYMAAVGHPDGVAVARQRAFDAGNGQNDLLDSSEFQQKKIEQMVSALVRARLRDARLALDGELVKLRESL